MDPQEEPDATRRALFERSCCQLGLPGTISDTFSVMVPPVGSLLGHHWDVTRRPQWPKTMKTRCFRKRAFDASIGLGPLIKPLLNRSWAILGLSWALLGLPWALLVPFGAALGRSRASLGLLLGPSWALLAPLVGTLGALLGARGPLVGTRGPSWEPFGTICGLFATLWGTSLDASGYFHRLSMIRQGFFVWLLLALR
jgi:hypothetical protein